uniref:Uncharacterized protein n=1 Tax=Arundo donax TaxID=35708 RepID=A0A0A9AGM3_ARUDO
MRHLGVNFFRQFKTKRLMDILKKLYKQNQRSKFNMIWSKLDKLTMNHVKEIKKIPPPGGEDEPKGLDPLPNGLKDTTRRRRGDRGSSASQIGSSMSQ